MKQEKLWQKTWGKDLKLLKDGDKIWEKMDEAKLGKILVQS